jgi:EAL domain-containing protein (putative c-di-GMP-specific phosphodiesterase class I)
MSINVSGRQLANSRFVANVAAILRETGVEPTSIVLEITESVLMHDVESISQQLRDLKDLGLRLAIDDFGTGYSSLAYLRQFPVDVLKIDRAFVEAVGSGAAGGRQLVQAIVDMGSSLELTTVAEGIETTVEAERMLALGCMSGQGYLFAQAMPAAEVTELLRRSPVAVVAAGHRTTPNTTN